MNGIVDNEDKGRALEGARRQIEEWRNYSAPEIPFRGIEKLMVDVLGVISLKSKSGSQRSFRHQALEGSGHHGPAGIFSVHVTHKKRPAVRKHDFRKYLYPALITIIEYLERRS